MASESSDTATFKSHGPWQQRKNPVSRQGDVQVQLLSFHHPKDVMTQLIPVMPLQVQAKHDGTFANVS